MAGIGDSASASAVVVSEARSVEVAAKEVHDVVVGGAFLASSHLFSPESKLYSFLTRPHHSLRKSPEPGQGNVGREVFEENSALVSRPAEKFGRDME